MELWFTEMQTPYLKLSFQVKEILAQTKSTCQEIVVLDTEVFGRVLVLDGFIQVTQMDEYIYHEMISHVPLVTHGSPGEVLVIGGGDGGTVREVLKHPEIKKITLVEIDAEVVEVCRRYLPETGSYLDDRRVHIQIEDGLEFLKNNPEQFDVIIVDSTEPVGPAKTLFSREFFRSCWNALKEDGVMVSQTESPFYNRDILERSFQLTRELFPRCGTYFAPVPSYPGGIWSFTIGSGRRNPCKIEAKEKAQSINTRCRYYSPHIHESSFSLFPLYPGKGEG